MTALARTEPARGTDLADCYALAFERYCTQGDEGALFEAYEIARDLLARKLTLTDFGTMHHAALSDALEHADDLTIIVYRAEEFYIEGVAVFDMAIRGYRQNVDKLEREIATRQEIEDELRSVTLELSHQRDKLDAKVQERTEELRRRATELEQTNRRLINSNKEQADFTYALSHDLKTPINTIDMFLEALIEDHGDTFDESDLPP